MVEYILQDDFLVAIEMLGTLAFAISGIRLASAKQVDWFGAYVIGLITAIGGGTVRDVLLGVTPFWMLNGGYLAVTAVGLLAVIIWGRYLIRLHNTFFIFDTIGLGFFVVVGMQKTLDAGFPFWVAVVMATITGSAGGVLRDILINEIPLIFRKEIYALACVIGGFFYWAGVKLGFSDSVVQVVSAAAVIATRVIAVKYKLSMPTLKRGESNGKG